MNVPTLANSSAAEKQSSQNKNGVLQRPRLTPMVIGKAAKPRSFNGIKTFPFQLYGQQEVVHYGRNFNEVAEIFGSAVFKTEQQSLAVFKFH